MFDRWLAMAGAPPFTRDDSAWADLFRFAYEELRTMTPIDLKVLDGQKLFEEAGTAFEALRLCAGVFRAYEAHHRAKEGAALTADENEATQVKADRNAAAAAMCERIVGELSDGQGVQSSYDPERDARQSAIYHAIKSLGGDHGGIDDKALFDRASQIVAYIGTGVVALPPLGPGNNCLVDDERPACLDDVRPLYQLRPDDLTAIRAALDAGAVGINGHNTDDSGLALIRDAHRRIEEAIAEREAIPPAEANVEMPAFTIGQGFNKDRPDA